VGTTGHKKERNRKKKNMQVEMLRLRKVEIEKRKKEKRMGVDHRGGDCEKRDPPPEGEVEGG